MELRKDVQVMDKKTEYLNPYVAKRQDYYGISPDDIWICADEMFEEVKEFEQELIRGL